jgi:hypothetical protein
MDRVPRQSLDLRLAPDAARPPSHGEAHRRPATDVWPCRLWLVRLEGRGLQGPHVKHVRDLVVTEEMARRIRVWRVPTNDPWN